MSETTEMVTGAVSELMTRLDAIAEKLGIAAEYVWKFTVMAKIVEAKRDFAKSAAIALLVFLFWGWAIHVALMTIPHEFSAEIAYETTTTPSPCTQYWNDGIKGHTPTPLQGTCMGSTQKPVDRKVDKGISSQGFAYVISGIVFALLGIIVLCVSVGGMIDGLAGMKKAEADAFESLLYDLRG
jgi:hypothetical protein